MFFQEFSLSSVSLGRDLDSVCASSSHSPSSFIHGKSMQDSSQFRCKQLYNLMCVPPPPNHIVPNAFLLSVFLQGICVPEHGAGGAVPPEAEEERCVVRNGALHPSPYFYAFGEMRTELLDNNVISMWEYVDDGDTLQAAELLCRQEQTPASPAFAPGAHPWPLLLPGPGVLSSISASPSSA